MYMGVSVERTLQTARRVCGHVISHLEIREELPGARPCVRLLRRRTRSHGVVVGGCSSLQHGSGGAGRVPGAGPRQGLPSRGSGKPPRGTRSRRSGRWSPAVSFANSLSQPVTSLAVFDSVSHRADNLNFQEA